MLKMIQLILLLIFIPHILCQFGTTTTTSTTTQPGNVFDTNNPTAVTLIPGVQINTSLITQRPDDEALNSLLSRLPTTIQTQIRNIRGNIFLTQAQQDEQIQDILSGQNAEYNRVYSSIKNATNYLNQNITNNLQTLSESAQNFIRKRQEVLNNTGIALFDFNGRLTSLVTEFLTYNDSVKNEIYNFLYTNRISNFTTGLDVINTVPSITLNETVENNLMNMVSYDSTKLPIKGFLDLLPSAQQTEFNNIVNNNALRKDQIMTQLQQLTNNWGPQYAAAFNNTILQRDQMIQLLMFLSPGLAEPYKTFVDRKIALMNNLSLTPAQEAQSMQSLVSSFASIKNAIKQFSNTTSGVTVPVTTPLPIFG